MYIKPEERIYVDTWQEICQEINSPKLIHATTDAAQDLLTDGPTDPSVLVLSYSDYGIWEQEENHPNDNFQEMFEAVAFSADWSSISRDHSSYIKMQVGPTCNADRCKVTDKYSMKVHRFTDFTFPEVHKNVKKLFSVNLNAKLPNAELIPFGLNRENGVTAPIDKFTYVKKDKLLYVNFQNYTKERVELKQHYSSEDFVTYRRQANLPIEQYLEELSRHKFCLAAPGNGLDCYRIYECILLGVIPILKQSHFSMSLVEMGLPVLVFDNLFGLQQDFLEEIYPRFLAHAFDSKLLTKSYWKSKIEAELKNV